jgi:hypothetical protein
MTVVNQKVDFIFSMETAGTICPYRKHGLSGVPAVQSEVGICDQGTHWSTAPGLKC